MEYKLIGHGAEAKIYLIESDKKDNNKYIFELNKDFLNKLELILKNLKLKMIKIK